MTTIVPTPTSLEDEAANELATIPFELAMKELETIVDRLEKGQVGLEESIAIYERGEALKAHCDALLKTAEMRIQKITLSRAGKPSGAEPLDSD